MVMPPMSDRYRPWNMLQRRKIASKNTINIAFAQPGDCMKNIYIASLLLFLVPLSGGYAAEDTPMTSRQMTELIGRKQAEMLKSLAEEPDPNIKMVLQNGQRWLKINDRLMYPWLVAIPGSTLVPNAQAYMKAYANAGFNLIKINIRSAHFVKGCYFDDVQDKLVFDFDNNELPPEAAKAGECNGFMSVTKRILAVLHANPSACILVGLDLSNSPRWWRKTQKSEFTKFADNNRLLFPLYNIQWYDTQPSLSSAIWQEYAENSVDAFVKFIENSPLSKRVIGYYITYGESYERFWPGWTNGTVDFSEAAKNGFQNYLAQKYTLQQLQEAWQTRTVTDFKKIDIPGEKERWNNSFGDFTYAGNNRKCMDFYEYLASRNQDIIEVLAKKARLLAGKNKIIGTAGLYWLAHTNKMYQQSAHPAAISRLLDCKYIDFINSTYSFFDRGIGGITSSPQPMESLLLHNKLGMSEEDLITPNFKTKVQTMMEDIDDWNGCIEAMTRDVLYSFMKGQGVWWLDLGGDRRYVYAPLIRRAGELKDMINKLQTESAKSAAEIALIVDPCATYYLTSKSPLLRCLQLFQMTELGRLGAPYDCYMISDLAKINRTYKMYIFLGAFNIPQETRTYINENLKKNSAVILWLYGTGIYDSNNNISAASISSIVDQQMEIKDERQELRGAIKSNKWENIHQDFQYGGGDRKLSWMEKKRLEAPFPYPKCSPIIYSIDPQAGHVANYLNSNNPCLSIKKTGTYTSIVCGTYTLPANILRNIAIDAGVHIYTSTDDFVVARESLILIAFYQSGKNIVKLPDEWKKCRELLTSREYTASDDKITIETPYGARVILLQKLD